MERHERVFVDSEFLTTTHGQIPCEDCHGGNKDALDFKKAHQGITVDPTFPDPGKTCGPCHPEITRYNRNSLHITLASYKRIIGLRINREGGLPEKLGPAMEEHCLGCHASCGQCHVSRPQSVGGGLLDGHFFQRRPPMEATCLACHGSRIGDEYFGNNKGVSGDIHFTKKRMHCVSCHVGDEMHGEAETVFGRYAVKNGPRCANCHPDAISDKSKITAHKIHKNRVSCYVCHAQPYKNCYSCHVGRDSKGLAYYQVESSKLAFKIGLNPPKDTAHPYTYVTVRHIPSSPELFAFYLPRAMENFDSIPTWKMATPHNIQRKTSQNQSCNACHGNPSLFLTLSEIEEAEKKANESVAVPLNLIPERRK